MRKLFLAAALFAATAAPSAAQTVYPYRPVAGAQHGLAVSSATSLSIPTAASYATICARAAAVNYTTDGVTAPTASVGTPIAAGNCVGLPGTLLPTFSALGSGATLDVEYFK